MISPTHTISPEWQNENTLRAYPLEDDAPAASVIPSWLLADMRITADTVYSWVFISNVYVSEHLISIGVSGVLENGTVVGLLTRGVTRDELAPFRTYSMDRLTDTATGTVSFGEPPDVAYTCKLVFKPEESKLLTSAVSRTMTPGVTRIVDKAHGVTASGLINLSGNSEFRTYLSPDDPEGKTIVIALDDLYRDITTSVCSTEPSFSACGETPVKTINGVAPTPEGVITLKFR